MPQQHVILLILLYLGACCLLNFYVHWPRPKVESNRHSLKFSEIQIAALVRLDFKSDHSLALLLRIEYVESEGQIRFLLRSVVVPYCVESCLSRETTILV